MRARQYIFIQYSYLFKIVSSAPIVFVGFSSNFLLNLVLAHSHPLVSSPHHTTATSPGGRRPSCASSKSHEVSQSHLYKLLHMLRHKAA